MSTKTKWFGLSIAATLGLLLSCSSSDDSGSGSPPSGGSAGSGSAGKAGSASTAGSNSSAGSGGRAGSGGVNNGGAPGGGSGGFNFGGGFDFGGAGFDPDDFACDPAPQAGSDCTTGAQPCLNGTEVCYCDVDSWACMDIFGGGGGAPGEELECPANQPTPGTPCETFGICPYGEQAGCACDGSMWQCT